MIRSLSLIVGVILAAYIASGCSAKRLPLCSAKEIDRAEAPFVVAILVTDKDAGGQEAANDKKLINYGSGFVLNAKARFIVTAKHGIQFLAGHELYALVGSKTYPLSFVWEHPTLDIGILKISSAEPVDLLQVEVSYDIPRRGSSALLTGFRLYGKRLHLHQVPVIIQKANKPMRIVAHDHENTGLERYNGLSGGPLLDNKNRIVAILEGGPLSDNHELFFVPLSAIPPKYLPQ